MVGPRAMEEILEAVADDPRQQQRADRKRDASRANAARQIAATIVTTHSAA